jgi:hypothetical protein
MQEFFPGSYLFLYKKLILTRSPHFSELSNLLTKQRTLQGRDGNQHHI